MSEHSQRKAQPESRCATWPTAEGERGNPSDGSALEPPLVVSVARTTDRLTWLERLGLVLLAAGLITVLAVARRLSPYEANGQPRRIGTHEQLGLPPCAFHRNTGIPCPTCGLTTSFSLCMHGDWRAAWQANSVGPILVLATALAAIWFLAVGLSGHRLGLPSWHGLSTLAAYILLVLVLASWVGKLMGIFCGGQ